MKNIYTKELLSPIISESKNWAEVCRKLGLSPMTGSQSHLKKKAEQFDIKIDHFLGRGSNKGKTFKKRAAIDYCKKDLAVSSHRLKTRLIRDGHKKALCEICGISEWQGENVPLELDHKDSNHLNNELSNLQVICPNCHAIETRKRRKDRKMAL